MPNPESFAFPEPRDDDDDDVRWALSAAMSEWQRGAYADTVIWLKRSIEAADASGNAFRAGELRAAVDELTEHIWASEDATGTERQGAPFEDTDVVDLDDSEVALEPMEEEESAPASEAVLELEEVELEDNDWIRGEEAWDGESGEVRISGPEFEPPLLGSPLDEEPTGRTEPEPMVFPPPSGVPLEEEITGQIATHHDSFVGRPAGELFETTQETRVVGDEESTPLSSQVSSVPPKPYSLSDIESIVASVRPPPLDPGAEPIDSLIAASLSSQPPASREIPPSSPPSFPPRSPQTEPAQAPDLPEAVVDGVPLAECPGFEDLPEDALDALVATVRLEHLAVDEEISNFAAAIVTHGAVAIVPTFGEEPGALATKGDVVFTRGSLDEGTPLRVIASVADTVVAVWDDVEFGRALAGCPWVGDELRRLADRFQALAGATLGLFGERLDPSLRRLVTDRMEVKAFAPGERIVEAGTSVPGLHIVGAGRVELFEEAAPDAVVEQVLAGDFLFPESVLGPAKAARSARAGSGGTLVLFAPRMVAHELLTSVPPLLEVLAS